MTNHLTPVALSIALLYGCATTGNSTNTLANGNSPKTHEAEGEIPDHHERNRIGPASTLMLDEHFYFVVTGRVEDCRHEQRLEEDDCRAAQRIRKGKIWMDRSLQRGPDYRGQHGVVNLNQIADRQYDVSRDRYNACVERAELDFQQCRARKLGLQQ